MDIAIDGLKSGTTALSDTVTDAVNAAMRTADEDVNGQEVHSSPFV
jgi:hypothetical protein